MKMQESYHDPQFADFLQGSFPARPEEEADGFTSRVMQSLPQCRRKPVLALLLAYIQSPFWLITAVILCLAILGTCVDSMLSCFHSLSALVVAVVSVVASAVFITLDMLRDADRRTATA